MFDDYEIKKAGDINFHDLGKITSEFFGRNDLKDFLNKYSPEEVSIKLNEYNVYTKEYWFSQYKKGNIFVLRDSTFSAALTYTKNDYQLKGSNNMFFDSSLNRLIRTLRPTTALPIYRRVEEKYIEKTHEQITHITKEIELTAFSKIINGLEKSFKTLNKKKYEILNAHWKGLKGFAGALDKLENIDKSSMTKEQKLMYDYLNIKVKTNSNVSEAINVPAKVQDVNDLVDFLETLEKGEAK